MSPLVDLGIPPAGAAWTRWAVATAWLALCTSQILSAFLTASTPNVPAMVWVATFSALATPAALLLLAVWRDRRHPTTVERVGDDLVITAPACLTDPLVVRVEDVAQVRYGDVGPPGGDTKGWPVLTSGPTPTVGLVLWRDIALPAREPAAWTGEEAPRRHRLASAVLMTAADPPSAAAALGELVGLAPVEISGRSASRLEP